MRKLIVLACIFVAACGGGGGGGGGGADSSLNSYIKIWGDTDFTPSMAQADFTGDGSKHVVVAGWRGSSSPYPPVFIFKIDDQGKVTNETNKILGTTVYAGVNYPIVADFNGDGIDDLFLGGFTDAPASSTNTSKAFISVPGQHHRQVTLTDPGTWNHGIAAADIDRDGDIDIVNSSGQMWINDGQGNFTFKNHDWNSSPGFWMHGHGVCVADFNNTGRPQVLITDLYTGEGMTPIQDNVIFELDATLKPNAMHLLPMPSYDVGSTSETSHDVACIVKDFNQDGKLDVVIISALMSVSGSGLGGVSTKQNRVQLYINQGNFVFTEQTNSFINYNVFNHSAYSPVVMDFNNDGNYDIWLKHYDWTGDNPNQLWINNGLGYFNQQYDASVRSTQSAFYSETKSDSLFVGPSLPIKVNGRWGLFVMSNQPLALSVGFRFTNW